MKLLSRLYEPTSGSILIDGLPIEEYSISELRKGITMLAQDHQLYPLSVEENIKLGAADAEAMDDQQKVEEAVGAAGAESIIKNFSDGYDTVLDPVSVSYISYAGHGNKGLETMQEDLQKPTNVSGELVGSSLFFGILNLDPIRQEGSIKSSLRTSDRKRFTTMTDWYLPPSARMFMRLFTSRIKLVAVDEPSSALDPEAEHRLFAKLREERKGRTMIFVTHRFGHLTKHANLIMYVLSSPRVRVAMNADGDYCCSCVKEGAIVETGTHADLMSRDGEYAHLYNIQAEAFESP